ncbi:MAG: membrane protein insertase YidC [Novosphingobium sp.]
MNNQRNIILAVVLSGLLLFGWDFAMRWFYPHQATNAAQQAEAEKPQPGAEVPPAKRTREGGLTDAGDIALEEKDLASALKSPERVAIKAPGLSGSINLQGGAIDDLTLNRHRAHVDKDSDPVRLFSPAGTPAQHLAQFGWSGEAVAVPGPATRWQVDHETLTPDQPVTLRWTNDAGQTFSITYAIDNDYMITATQTVANRGTAPIVIQPIAQLNRTDKTASTDTWNVHSGPFGAFDQAVSFGPNYKDVKEHRDGVIANDGVTNWIGFSDIYWMSALIPAAGERASSDFRSLGHNIYLADLFYRPQSVPAGKQASQVTKLFAGAKESKILDRYEASGIPKFGLAIDWGWFRWFERPIFLLLDKLFSLAGNFGVAIILLTLIIRGLMFPIAQKQFASMAAMRAIQPKMKALQERYKDDKQKQQQEIMALYKQEGVNPLSGCLPLFLQIPIFFALYKVLLLTIEMRHQPFALWIKDLSAPDPLHILNLFGLLPFDPPSFLGIGVLALLLGISMFLQFKLNPAAMDPTQQQIFMIMPWFMMFIMAPFASGLLIYWITSNVLTIAQQWYLYRRHPQLKAQAEKDKAEMVRKKGQKDKGAGA